MQLDKTPLVVVDKASLYIDNKCILNELSFSIKSKEIVENFYTSLFKGEEGVLDNYLHPNYLIVDRMIQHYKTFPSYF